MSIKRSTGYNSVENVLKQDLKYNNEDTTEKKRNRGETSGLHCLPPQGDQWTFITSHHKDQGLKDGGNSVSSDAEFDILDAASLGCSSMQIHHSFPKWISKQLGRTSNNEDSRIESVLVQSHSSNMFENIGLDDIGLYGYGNKGNTAGLLSRKLDSNGENSLNAIEVDADESLILDSCQSKINPRSKYVGRKYEHCDDNCAENNATDNISKMSLNRIHVSLSDQCTSKDFRKSEVVFVTTAELNSELDHWDDDDFAEDKATDKSTKMSLNPKYASLFDQGTSENVLRKTEMVFVTSLDATTVTEHWDDDDGSENEVTTNTTKFSFNLRHEIPMSPTNQSTCSENVLRKYESVVVNTLDTNSVSKVNTDDSLVLNNCQATSNLRGKGEDQKYEYLNDGCFEDKATDNSMKMSLNLRNVLPASLSDQCTSSEAVFGKSEMVVVNTCDANSVPEHWDDDGSENKATMKTFNLKHEMPTSLCDQYSYPEDVLRKSETVVVNTLDTNSVSKVNADDSLVLDSCQATSYFKSKYGVQKYKYLNDDGSENEATDNPTNFSFNLRHEIPMSPTNQSTCSENVLKSETIVINTLDTNSVSKVNADDSLVFDSCQATCNPRGKDGGRKYKQLNYDNSENEATTKTTKFLFNLRHEIPASVSDQCTSSDIFRKSEMVVANSVPEHWDDDDFYENEATNKTKIIFNLRHEISMSPTKQYTSSEDVERRSEMVVVNTLDTNSVIEHWDDDEGSENEALKNSTKISYNLRHKISVSPSNQCISSEDVSRKSETIVVNTLDTNCISKVNSDESLILNRCQATSNLRGKDGDQTYEHLNDSCSEDKASDNSMKISLNLRNELPASLPEQCTSSEAVIKKSETVVFTAPKMNSELEHWDDDDSSEDETSSSAKIFSMIFRHPACILNQSTSETVFRKSECPRSQSKDELHYNPFNSKLTSSQAGLCSDLTDSIKKYMKVQELQSHEDVSVRVIPPELTPKITIFWKENRCRNVNDWEGNEFENSLPEDPSKISLNSHLLSGDEHSKPITFLAQSTLFTEKAESQVSVSNSSNKHGHPDDQMGSPHEVPWDKMKSGIFDGYFEDSFKDSGIELSASTAPSANPSLPTESISILTSFLGLNPNPSEYNPMSESNLALSLQQMQDIKIMSQELYAKKMLLAAVCQTSIEGRTTPCKSSTSSSHSVAEQAALKENHDNQVDRVLNKPSILRFHTRNTYPSQLSSAKKMNPYIMSSSQNQECEHAQSSSAAQLSCAAPPPNRELSDEEMRKILTQVKMVSSTDNKIVKTKLCPVLRSKESKSHGSSSKQEKLNFFSNDARACINKVNVKEWSLKGHYINAQSLELPQNLMHPSQLLRKARKVTRLRDSAKYEDFRIPRTTTQCLMQTAPLSKGFITQNSQNDSAGMSKDTTKFLQQTAPQSKVFMTRNSQNASARRMTSLTTESSIQNAPVRGSVGIRNTLLQNAAAGSSRRLPHSLKRPSNPSALVRAALSSLREESKKTQKTAQSSKMTGDIDVMQQLLTATPVSLMLTSLKYFPKDRSTSN